MQIVIAAVGKARRDPVARLFDVYVARIKWSVVLKEVECRKALPVDQLKEREGELLLSAVPPGATVVALDESGDTLTSGEFATRLRDWRDRAALPVVFLIGGAAGHGDAVRQRADLTLSLGRMTWPHLLVRGMLAEQLYRAQQILIGHPYHRE